MCSLPLNLHTACTRAAEMGMTTWREDREILLWTLMLSISSSLPYSGATLSYAFSSISFPAVLLLRQLLLSASGFLLLLLHHCSSVVTWSFGQPNCFHLWFPNASGATQYFSSYAPFTDSFLPLPLSVLRLSSFFVPFLLFQLIPWHYN